MPRPITLFTGQWADLPFEEVAARRRAGATTGSRSPAGATTSTRGRPPRTTPTSRASSTCWRSTASRSARSPTTSRARPSATTRSTPGTEAILSAQVWGDGDPEGVRQRAAEEMKNDRAGGRSGSASRPSSASPARRSGSTSRCSRRPSQEMVDAGYQDFADRWNPILDVFDECGVRFAHEVHPSRDRLRLLDDRARRWRRSATARRSASTGTRATSCGRTSTRSASCGTSRTGSTTSTARTRSCRSATAATAGSARTCRGPTRGAAGTSSPPATATCRGRVLPDAQHDRLRRPDLGRVGGRRHGPTSAGAPEALEFVAGGWPSTAPTPPSTRRSAPATRSDGAG